MSMPKTARPQAVIADLKIRSGISPLEASNRGAGCAVIDVTFVASTGWGPGISGRENAGLAIATNLAETCYKGVKIETAFRLPPQSVSGSRSLGGRFQVSAGRGQFK